MTLYEESAGRLPGLQHHAAGVAAVLAIAGTLTAGAPQARAMTNFARKYNVGCSYCHTQIPALNEAGYKFRAAGFRLPDDIGKDDDKKFDLGDYFAARLQSRWDTQVTNQPNGARSANLLPSGAPGPRTTTNAISFMEATLYPLTGAWGKYLSSLSELSTSPEDVFEIENAYVRFVKGKSDKFFTGRVGVFHPWEGYGASDRPYSNVRPLFQTNPLSARAAAVPYVFQPWGLDEAGGELGMDIKRLSLRAAVLGGTLIRWNDESQAFVPFPAQTGPWKGANQVVSGLTKPYNSLAHNTPDFSANATYVLHPNGGGVSLLYYHGNVATPTTCTSGLKIGQTDPVTKTPCSGEDVDFTNPATQFRNNFDRTAAYLSYPLGKKFLPQGSFSYGSDTAADHSKFHSKGAFADGVFFLTDEIVAGVRYDWFHPNTARLNTQWAITPYVNIAFQNGLQVIAEYQHRDFQLDAVNHRKNDTVQARLIFIK
jgi:hypothetical protein